MYSKGILERFIAETEATAQLPSEEVAKLRARVETLFFNEFGFCAGQIDDDLFSDHKELLPYLHAKVNNLADAQDYEGMRAYEPIVRQEPYITDGMIERFIDILESEGYNPESIAQFRMRRICLRQDELQVPNAPQIQIGGLHGVISAEWVLQDLELIKRFREMRSEIIQPHERTAIELLRAAL